MTQIIRMTGMKQIFRILSMIALVFLGAGQMWAQSNPRVTFVYEGNHGTASASAADGSGKVTITVTPVGDYRCIDGDVTAETVISSINAGARTRTSSINYGETIAVTCTKTNEFTLQLPANENEEVRVNVKFSEKLTFTPTVSITDWTYGEAANDPTVGTSNTSGGGVTYTYADTENGTYSTTVPTQAGSHWVKATVAATVDYKACVSAPVKFTISQKTVTVTAEDKSKVYGADDPTLTATVAGTIGTDVVIYTLGRAEGSDVGEYAITASGDAAQGNYNVTFVGAKFTITAKTVSAPTITLSETSYVYDGQEKKPTVTVKDGNTEIPATEYSVSYTNNVNVGTATATITDVAGGNYTVSGSATFAISAADGSLTAPTAVSDLEYSGKAQTLISAGSSTTGTVKYSLDNKTYSTDIPQGTDAKEYTVYYKLEGDANHNGIDAASLKVSIAPKGVTVTAVDASKVYGADDPTLTATVAGIIGTDKVDYTLSRAEGSDVGEYTITASGDAAQGNYSVTFVGAKLTITKADGSLTAPTAVSKLEYSGKAQTLISAGSSTTGTIQYSLNGTTYGTDIPQGTDAKEYTVYYKSVGDKNHNDVAAASLKVSISQKAVTVTANDASKVYGADDPTLTATVAGTIGTDKVIYKLSRAEGSDVGEYAITASGDKAQGNYTVTFVGAKFTITKADGSLTAPTAVSDLIYSGKAQALISSAGSSTTGTIQYSLDGTTYGTDLPTGTDAKEYTVYYKSVGDKNHNDVAAASLKVTIAPKSVTVTAEDKTKVEGEADPELTAKVEGLIGTDKVAYTLSRDKGETVGEYTITASGDAAQGNYAVTFVGAKLTITAKPKPSGDVNGDGVVNIVDVVALSKAILAGSTDEKYDINGDGSINAKDITALVALIANL